MLQTNRTTYPSGSSLNLLDALSSRPGPTPERAQMRREQWSELAIDDALAESFPASDPPAWNSGMGRPMSVGAGGLGLPTNRGTADALNVSASHDSERTLLQAFISLAGAVGIALLVPFAILLVGLPIALTVRGLLEVVLRLLRAIG